MKNQYEGMFLFDPSFAGEFANAENEIKRLMERAEAELVFCRRWDERKLAYEIAGRKRGVYVLAYFRAAPEKIKGIERDAQLSESILRLLVLRADDVTLEQMDEFAPPEKRRPERPAEEAATGATARRPDREEADEEVGESAAVGAGVPAAAETDGPTDE